MPWNMNARITSMTTSLSLYTPSYLVISTYYWCKQDIYIRWETEDSIVGVCKSWNSYILENSTTHSTHHCIYYTLHITFHRFQSTYTDANRAVMWWYTLPNERYNLEGLGENSRLHSVLHHKWNSRMRFTCLLYTPRHIYYTSQCIFLRKIWHTTLRMLSMTSSVSPYNQSSHDHIFLIQTINIHW
jgi:hypothetical protein